MKKSDIHIDITLDDNFVCEKIVWNASDKPVKGAEEAKALSLAIWDRSGLGTAKIDLWTKDMEVQEMKQFVLETIAGMADTIRKATGDELMAAEMEELCRHQTKRLERELRDMM
ncbi:MAG: gliding motility protein GldC [Microscillaceae bacterium]|nr:gliding motility protein GldC [Microscillaceae bacterium]MDW8461928.1 gliding motility protein GldC [Cytophagales bacterium]